MTPSSAVRYLSLFCWPIAAFAVDPFATHNPAHFADEQAAYLDASLFLGNDVIPVKTLLSGDKWKDDYTPKDGKNLAVASARVESGVAWHSLRIGYVARQEWSVRAQRDTLDIYRASQLKQNFPTGMQKIQYELEGWSAQGMQLGGAWRKPLGDGNWKLDFGLSLSLLKGDRLRRENWQGSVNPIGNDVLVTNASVTRDFDQMDKDLLRNPMSLPGSTTGSGYALDLGFSVGREDGWRLDWAVADALGALSWKNVPSETLSTTDYIICQTLDAACSAAKLNPAYADLAGGTSPKNRDFSLHLKPKHMLTLSAPVNQAFVELGDSYRDGEHFPRIAVRQHLRDGWGTRVDYDFRMRSVGLALAHRWLYMNYQTDSLSPDKAKVIALGVGARIPF
jgi:hypothetical protein